MNTTPPEPEPLFNVIGYDQTVYGPVTVDTVKEWIAQGVIHDKTPAQRNGAPDWQTLADFEEFASCFLSAAATRSAPAAAPAPSTGPVDPARLLEETLARGPRVNIDHCFRRAWTLVRSDLLAIAGISLMLHLLLGAASTVVVGALLAGVLHGGFFYLLLQRARGRSSGLKELFAGFTIAFVPLLLAGVVMSLLVGLASLFFLLPGIYLATAWVFTLPLVIDKGLGFWEAMGVSRRVVNRQFWSVLGLVVTGVALSCFGYLCFGVGALVTVPLFVAALAYAYEDLFTVDSPASRLEPARPDARVSRWLATSLLVPGVGSLLVAAAIAAVVLNGIRQNTANVAITAAPDLVAPANAEAAPASLNRLAPAPVAPAPAAPVGVEMLSFTPKAAGRKGGYTYRLENRGDKPVAEIRFDTEFRDADGVLEQSVPFGYRAVIEPHAKEEEQGDDFFMSEITRRVTLVPKRIVFADGSQWSERSAAVAASAPGALSFAGHDAPASVELIRFRPKGAGKENGVVWRLVNHSNKTVEKFVIDVAYVDAAGKVEKSVPKTVEDPERAVAPGGVHEGKESDFFMTASTRGAQLAIRSLTFSGGEQWQPPKKEAEAKQAAPAETAVKPAPGSEKELTPADRRKARRARKAAGETK